MSSVGEDIITILLGILFYLFSLLSIIGTLYSYLKQWDATRKIISNIEMTATNPIVRIILVVIKYSQYLAIPVIICGLIWYNYYASATI